MTINARHGSRPRSVKNLLKRFGAASRSDCQSRDASKTGLEMEKLEDLNMLAPLYPDMFAWADEGRGYLYDYRVEGDLLRFSTALANMGDGHLELRGGTVLPNGNQEVIQRIFHDDGSFEDFVAGEFTYHPGHGHLHFDGYATYNLRATTEGGGVGDIVATGGKISFCLIDIAQYDPNAGSSNYHSCGQIQGVSAGWTDVYSSGLSNQWINIAGIPDGDYWLEVIVDPDQQLIEADETNNTTQIPITIAGGPGDNGDRYEPNNNFVQASNFGLVSYRQESGMSIHTDADVDYYQFTAVEDGDFEVTVDFTHSLGNLDAYIYDSSETLIASGNSTDDLEILNWFATGGETYYLKVEGAGGETNGFGLTFDGPGNIATETIKSPDGPVNIPDGAGSSSPGQTAYSTLEGPDFTLSDLNLIFDDLDHTWLGDLHIELTSPSGTTAVILTSDFEPGGGLLGGSDNFTGTILDDQAPTNLADGTAPYTGSFNVEHSNVATNPLSVFNGESSLGTWTVAITDWFSADTGTLRSWSLMFTGINNNPGDEFEQNDAFPQATWLGDLGSAQIEDASIHIPTDEDFYRFKALATGVANVDMSFLHSAGNLDFVVYNDALVEIARSDSMTDNESTSFNVLTNGLYYIQVVGANGETNDYDLAVNSPVSVMESGSVVPLGTDWQAVTFGREFVNPVVILSTPGSNDSDAVTTRIRNVTSTGFEMQLMEWGYQDGSHATEDIGYLVIEAGHHQMPDGTIIEAGHQVDASNGLERVQFDTAFAANPILIAQVDSDDSQALVTRSDGVSDAGFSIMVQPHEGGPTTVTADVHWMAIVPGTGTLNDRPFEAGVTATASTEFSHNFASAFSTAPVIFGSVQSYANTDTVVPRTTSVTATGFDQYLQEDKAKDKEVFHEREFLGYLALGVPSAPNSITVTPPGPQDNATDSTGNQTRDSKFDRFKGLDAFRDSFVTDTVDTTKLTDVVSTDRVFVAEAVALKPLFASQLEDTDRKTDLAIADRFQPGENVIEEKSRSSQGLDLKSRQAVLDSVFSDRI